MNMRLILGITAGATAALAVAIVSPAPASRYPYDPAPVLERDPRRATAGEYRLEPAHSSVTVTLSHMGLSQYTLRFDGISGRYHFDPAHPTATKVEIAIDPTSIDTGNPKFDAMIARTYLEAAAYPQIRFTSMAMHAHGNRGTVTGLLDMHGIERPITLKVTYNGFYDVEKPERMGFSASATLARSVFGVDPNVPAEGDDVTIQIQSEFRRT